MSELQIKRGQHVRLGKVSTGLVLGNNARVDASVGNLVVVAGPCVFRGAAILNCNFECDSISAERGGIVRVRGNLLVHNKIDIDHSLEVEGTISAGEIDVGGSVVAKKIECTKIRAGRMVEASETLSADRVDVGGKLSVKGNVRINDLGVGSKVSIGGGNISGTIRVGGRFESGGALEFGDLESFGRTDFYEDSTGRRISTSGKVTAAKNLHCDEIDFRGVTQVRGDCSAKKIHVNGKLIVDGSIIASDSLEVYGTADIGKQASVKNLRIAGKFRARKATDGAEADLAGVVETTEGLEANLIAVSSGTTCKGPLIGDRVEVAKSSFVLANWRKNWYGQMLAVRLVGKMTRVEDIMAREAYLGSTSLSRRVFCDSVEVGSGAYAEEILYTKEITGQLHKAKFGRAPEKVAKLPNIRD